MKYSGTRRLAVGVAVVDSESAGARALDEQGIAAEAPPPTGAAAGPPRPRVSAQRIAGMAALALLAALVATTKVTITGNWYGIYLLARPAGRPLALKDDLRLGDGPNLIAGVSFSGLRAMVAADGPRRASLALEWNEEDGSGMVRNRLEDGRELVTLFGRNLDDEGADVRGLFVGGALPDVAGSAEQNQSGMALRDARGWNHVWCNSNETLYDDTSRTFLPPGRWKFLGAEVVIDGAPDRIVLRSGHEVALPDGELRVDRFAYFKAGRPFFRLGINVMNLSDAPVRISYLYGDEPWVGEFGSAEGNQGWVEGEIVPTAGFVDPGTHRWAGVVDVDSGVANFISWDAAVRPDRVFFGNRAGTPRPADLGRPLDSNEIFIGMEWRTRTLGPGELLSLQLTLGLAELQPNGIPRLPDAVLTPR